MRHERGNILFLILLAVVLFAALTYAVNSGMRGGGKNANTEKAQLNQAVLDNFQAEMDSALMRLKSTNGCADAQISYETPSGANANSNAPTDKHCHVFSPLGAGVPWRDLGLGTGCTLTSLSVGQNCNGIVYVGMVGSNRVYTPTSDQGVSTWNNGSSSFTTTNVSSATDGLANTNALIALNDSGAPYAAAQTCRTLGSAWYLPSMDEVNLLYANRSTGALNGTLTTSSYWSSTERDLQYARNLRFSDGQQFYNSKSLSMSVRCTRHD